MSKTYGLSGRSRVFSVGMILFGAASLLYQFPALFLGHSGGIISAETHVGVVFGFMAISVVMILSGVSGLRARLDVDAIGMRRERHWLSRGLDVRWEQVEAWGCRTVVTTGWRQDEWGGGGSTWETRKERLDIALSTPPSCIRLSPDTQFFREIVEALRTHTPAKEQALPVEKA